MSRCISVASFTKEVKPSVAKPPLEFNDSLAKISIPK